MTSEDVAGLVERLWRAEAAGMLGALSRRLGDFDLAEEALAEAVTDALKLWPDEGVPDSPTGWLVTTGWRKALDRLRRESVGREKLARVGAEPPPPPGVDDRLAMIFACCHPDLAEATRVALTLYAASGLTHRRDRRGVPGAGADDGAAAGPGQEAAAGEGHPVRAARRPVDPAAGRPRGDLPGVQRGLPVQRPVRPAPRAGPRRARPGPSARPAAAPRAGGRRAHRAAGTARGARRHPVRLVGTHRAARAPGPPAVGRAV